MCLMLTFLKVVARFAFEEEELGAECFPFSRLGVETCGL